MFAFGRYQRDVYKCIHCKDWIAGGDIYCKHCGHKFVESDVQIMTKESTFIKAWNAPFHGSFDELHRCEACKCFIALSYNYCKQCGYEFTENDKQRMKNHGKENFHDSIKYGSIFFALCILVFTVFIILLK